MGKNNEAGRQSIAFQECLASGRAQLRLGRNASKGSLGMSRENQTITDTSRRDDLGECSDVAAIQKLIAVTSLELLDVGCGAAAASRELVRCGAIVTGLEPDPIQAERNRSAMPMTGLTLLEGRAEALPVPDQSVDGVIFFRSLHHVPLGSMDTALREATRVLRQGSGFLAVVEPGMTGSHFKVMRPFHDETSVRIAAQAALSRLCDAGFYARISRHAFVQYPRHANFEEMVERVTGQTFNSISREMVETDEVRYLFEHGRTDQGDYAFEQPMLLDLFSNRL